MSTPIGHSLLAVALARLSPASTATPVWRWYVFAIFCANAADLDFLPGLIGGDINMFHQGPSHSILATCLFAILAGTVAGRWLQCAPPRAAMAGGLFYASHLVLDFFREDNRFPFGIPLLWPLSDTHWIASTQIFRGIKHGVPGDSVSVFLGEVFSMHNLTAISIEVLVLLPIVVVFFLATRRKTT